MLKTIKLHNIKGHMDSELNLSPGLNVITGDSDSGKSTVMRALNWLVTNQRGYNPKPFKHLKSKGSSYIEVETIQGNLIRRTKDTKFNGYSVNGEDFKALGSDIPEEVKSALNLTELNLQAQKDSYFLLNDTPGQVAKAFNKIADLTVMDQTLQSVKGLRKSNSKVISKLKDELTLVEEKLKELDYVEDASLELERLESVQVWVKKKESQHEKLKAIVETVRMARKLSQSLLPSSAGLELKALEKTAEDVHGNYTVFNRVHCVKVKVGLAKKHLLEFQQVLTMQEKLQTVVAWKLRIQAESKKLNDLKQTLHDMVEIKVTPEQLIKDFDILNSRIVNDKQIRHDHINNKVKDIVTATAWYQKRRVTCDEAENELTVVKEQLGICQECGRPI